MVVVAPCGRAAVGLRVVGRLVAGVVDNVVPEDGHDLDARERARAHRLARGAEPQLRVWEREDLTFHATGESLRPARISAGDPRGGDAREFSLDGDGEKKNGEAEAEPDSMPHAPPLAWQPRGALVAVACAPQRAREDSDVDSTSASDARDDEASRRRGVKGRAANAASARPPRDRPTPPDLRWVSGEGGIGFSTATIGAVGTFLMLLLRAIAARSF